MPSIAITRPYEAVYILDPTLGEEQINTVTAKYRQIVENNGGTVEKLDIWERRKLAYEIKGRTEGIYVIMQFSGKASVENELRRVFQISEDQIRSMIVKRDEGEPALGREERPAPAMQAAPTPVPIAEAAPPPQATAVEDEAVPEAEMAAASAA